MTKIEQIEHFQTRVHRFSLLMPIGDFHLYIMYASRFKSPKKLLWDGGRTYPLTGARLQALEITLAEMKPEQGWLQRPMKKTDKKLRKTNCAQFFKGASAKGRRDFRLLGTERCLDSCVIISGSLPLSGRSSHP